MTDEIGTTLTTALATVLPNFNLSETQTESYPYSVYDYTPKYSYCKDGLYKVASDVTITLVGKDLPILETYAAAAHTAISGLTEGKFITRHNDTSRIREDGLWNVVITYRINQLY